MSRALEISVSGKNEIVSRIAADRYRSENDSKIVLLIFAFLGAPSGTIGRCSAFVRRAGAKARHQVIGVAEEYLAHIGDPLGAAPGAALDAQAGGARGDLEQAGYGGCRREGGNARIRLGPGDLPKQPRPKPETAR